MKLRVVQIWGFLLTVLGWIFVACTMAMEGWKITSIGGMGGSSIIKVAWYWSSLWRSCFTDSTAVSNCYDYPVLWSVEGHIQIVRGLLMAALTLGMLGFVLSLLGMECTFLGGKDKSKYKKIYAGGCCHITSGLLSICGYAVYAEYVSVEYFNPNFDGLKYDLGTPLFLGWVGSAFHMTGGFFYLWSVCKPLCGAEVRIIKVQPLPDPEQNKPTAALSTVSEFTSKTKVSSVSELSSRSERSDVSGLSSGSERTSRSGRTSNSGWSSKTGRTSGSAGSRSGSESVSGSGSESGLSSRSSVSTLAESRSSRSSSRSSRTVSPLSLRSETTPFIQNSSI
ncbi:claudin-10 [Echeneis naucrates]|uniref:Claudin-10-like n=1 Tax=Echeneis naucrates TaxID=173247 RepID=A0A665WB58_ECHNA|nr:claudin-10-like [Echeneis naucrates]